MTAQNNPTPDTSDREIVISRVLTAPRELVWQAWTDPKHVTNWWGPRGFTTSIKKMDFRVGGTWEHVMHGPDGANYPNKSTFKEIVPLERITFLHGGGREEGPGATFVATWTFETVEGNKTRLTGRLVFPSPEARDFVVKEFGA
ncbi:MAG: Activator of Hsp90 ATPase 1 family protein, partial [Lacunisphaera sp.]|nr:Activator of Hsp90 ATPase 1 family protein [Lacunisphaera sp.]